MRIFFYFPSSGLLSIHFSSSPIFLELANSWCTQAQSISGSHRTTSQRGAAHLLVHVMGTGPEETLNLVIATSQILKKVSSGFSSMAGLFLDLDIIGIHKPSRFKIYILEHANKSIHKACIKVDCGPVCFECLDNVFNEGQSECWCVIFIALAFIE